MSFVLGKKKMIRLSQMRNELYQHPSLPIIDDKYYSLTIESLIMAIYAIENLVLNIYEDVLRSKLFDKIL